ncbi:MAG: ABC transporter substrate-binding protein [Trueperaceae bacterium]
MKTLITQLWLLACLLLAVAVEAEPLEPRRLVEITVDEVMADMKASAETYTRDPAALQAMVIERVGPHFNFPRMAQLAMARHWATATPAQRRAIAGEFRTLLARTYANAMFEYRDAPIRVMGEQKSNPRNRVVKLRLDSPSGQPVDLLVRLENRNERWQVIDVVVGGISLVITYRGAFNDRIGKSGINGLIADMRGNNLGVSVQ